MTKRIVTASLALAIAPFAAGCASTPGVVQTSGDSALVAITAGDVAFVGGLARSSDVVDKDARLCWFMVGVDVSAVDCCALRRVAAVRPFIAWDDDASCAARGVPSTMTTAAAAPAKAP